MPVAVSVVSCRLDRSNTRMGSFTVGKSDINTSVCGSYQLRYIVQTASAASPLSVVVNGQAVSSPFDKLPKLWDTYSYKGDTDTSSFCKSIDVDRDPNSVTVYYVTCNFEPAEDGEVPEGGTSPRDKITDPMSRPPRIWWDRETQNELVSLDKDAKVVTTPVKTLYEDVLERERKQGLMVVEWNIETFAEFSKLYQDYANSRNKDPWNILGRTDINAGQALVRQIDCSSVKVEGNYIFYTASMRFALAETGKTWIDRQPLLARSYFKKNSGTASGFEEESPGVYKRYYTTDLVPINDDGTRKGDDQDVSYKDIKHYREQNFNTLPFMALFDNVV